MSKIFYFMGKSAAGKDTIFQKIQKLLTDLRTVVIYTTRPIREGEEDGVAYHFVTEERMRELEREGKIIELRAYNTVHGIWYYFTADDGQFSGNESCVAIGTLESFEKMQNYFGKENVIPIYIHLSDMHKYPDLILSTDLNNNILFPVHQYNIFSLQDRKVHA